MEIHSSFPYKKELFELRGKLFYTFLKSCYRFLRYFDSNHKLARHLGLFQYATLQELLRVT